MSMLSSDHLPILIRLQMKTTTTQDLHRTYVNPRKANWDRYRQEVEADLSKRSHPIDCKRDENIFRTILLKAASHHISNGKHRLHKEPVPAEILDVMTRRDDLRKRDPTSHELPRLNYYIQNRIYAHKRKKWRDFTLLMTYETVGRLIINYAAPVWSTNLRDTNYRNIQSTQNEALRIATGCHKMYSVDHLHIEARMMNVREHSKLLSAQYLARCLEPENVCRSITTRQTPKRRMKETLFTRHSNTEEPMMLANRKATLQAIHTDAFNKAVKDQKNNIDDLPHPINDSEKDLTRKERATIAQLRSGYCKLLGSYKSRIKKDASLNVCADCGQTPHVVKHLFVCPAHPTTLIPSDIWTPSRNSAISRRET